jgi:hypothetical protein
MTEENQTTEEVLDEQKGVDQTTDEKSNDTEVMDVRSDAFQALAIKGRIYDLSRTVSSIQVEVQILEARLKELTTESKSV